MKEKGLYIIAIIGSIICFIGDNLLGFFTPTPNFGNKIVGISFSYEWAEVDPARFALAGLKMHRCFQWRFLTPLLL